jgi:hypothetical protein
MSDLVSDFNNYWHVWLVGALLLLVAIGFVVRFILPARQLGRQLDLAIERLQAIKAGAFASQAPLVDLDAIREAMVTAPLAHLWREYTQTLHPQKEADGAGGERIVRWRAGSMAEAFFTEQALVDTPLKTEFYKHLPGILTGIGIIGTFSGLILGLTHFEVSGNTDIVRDSLRGLIQGVGHAFKVSAAAIALAMLFTWIEKSLVTARHRQVERLAQLIDSLFDAGAGEEYLARLVRASETSAQQSAELKDAIVAELGRALANMAEQQIEATARHQKELAATLANTVAAALREPMTQIAGAIEKVGSGQNTAISEVLERSLATFATTLQDSVGGQVEGMNSLLQETATAMQSSVAGLERVVAKIESSSKDGDEALNAQLGKTLAALEASQRAIADNLKNFLGQLGQQVSQSAASQEQQQSRLAEQTSSVVGDLATQVRILGDELRQTSNAMQSTVSGLSQANREAIGQLVTGAQAVRAACGEFATINGNAGREITAATQAVSTVSATMNTAASSLGNAAKMTGAALDEQRRSREAFAVLIGELNTIIDNARREASLTEGLVGRMEAGAERLGVAGKRAEDYLQGVTQVLGEAHAAFASNVEKTLKQGNAQFHRELAEAVGYLKGAVEDLGEALDAVVVRR